jgi:hypothetical protein
MALTASPHLAPNPGIKDIIHIPASQFTRSVLNKCVYAGHPKRAAILEYALFNPKEAPLLLLRIEQNRRFAIVAQKVSSYVRELCEFLRVGFQHVQATDPTLRSEQIALDAAGSLDNHVARLQPAASVTRLP